MDRRIVIGLVGALALLHHDVWFWGDPTLLFGAVPVGLAWHAAFSLACAGVWWWVTRYAWPVDPFGGEE